MQFSSAHSNMAAHGKPGHVCIGIIAEQIVYYVAISQINAQDKPAPSVTVTKISRRFILILIPLTRTLLPFAVSICGAGNYLSFEKVSVLKINIKSLLPSH